MQKIIKKFTEPSRIETGSAFTLKIKAIRYATYEEIRNRLTYEGLKTYTYSQLKGE